MLIHRLLYIGRWRVDFFFAHGTDYDYTSVMECLEDMDAPAFVLEESWYKMRSGALNEGFSFAKESLMRSCIFIGPTSSGSEFLDTFTHELRHLADDIASFIGIDLHGEDVAYLTGDTTRDLADVICALGCHACRD